MNGTMKLVAPLLAALAIAACNAGGTSNMPASAGASQGASAFKHVPEWMAKHEARTQCPQVVGRPTCLALEVEKGGISSALLAVVKLRLYRDPARGRLQSYQQVRKRLGDKSRGY